MNVRDIGNTTK